MSDGSNLDGIRLIGKKMLNECDEGHEIRLFHRVSEKNLTDSVRRFVYPVLVFFSE
ncbi:hypothetical protein [Photorhabdus laumondii]|uniref:hypothetical protein n=1 Tax=Photorhabdus laumondii TaxID=2218628 RepID=UPI000A7BA58F|nr:hypothetical protein [Photorhabdus laumondii]NDL48678.1 hypothetical protein [Photorhabdus laumondii subsp. laumondii]